MSQQKVQVFAIGLPRTGTPKEKRRFYMRWRIDGRDKMRALKTKGEAERLRTRLHQALLSDQRFDPSDTDSRGWWRFRLPDNREITVHVTTVTAASDVLDTTESLDLPDGRRSTDRIQATVARRHAVSPLRNDSAAR